MGKETGYKKTSKDSNREYKSDVFSMLLMEKARALEIYNAINGTSYEDLGKAINQAINQCIREDILKDFLIENRWEVTKVMQLDYTFERQLELEREAASEATDRAWQQGRTEGRSEGRLQQIILFVQNGDISVERGAEEAGMSMDAFEKAMKFGAGSTISK